MNRDFYVWLSTFRESIATFDYYVNFEKVYANAYKLKRELHLFNSLIGSEHIEDDFRNLINDYPKVLHCVPILLAVRNNEILVLDNQQQYNFNFKKPNVSVDEYVKFMNRTGLFDLFSKHLINNAYDYVLGVETGLDSNARKNRTGNVMERICEEFISQTCTPYELSSQVSSLVVKEKYGIEFKSADGGSTALKRYDFVVHKNHSTYIFEVNFYGGGGSKLNETARSYKMIAEQAKDIPNCKFIWITDGRKGWYSAKNNLRETFDVLPTLYNLQDLENGVLKELIS